MNESRKCQISETLNKYKDNTAIKLMRLAADDELADIGICVKYAYELLDELNLEPNDQADPRRASDAQPANIDAIGALGRAPCSVIGSPMVLYLAPENLWERIKFAAQVLIGKRKVQCLSSEVHSQLPALRKRLLRELDRLVLPIGKGNTHQSFRPTDVK